MTMARGPRSGRAQERTFSRRSKSTRQGDFALMRARCGRVHHRHHVHW